MTTQNWEQRRSAVEAAIGDRSLVWFGIRGIDAAPLLALPQLHESYSVIATMQAAGLDAAESLEDMTGVRVDLDRYDIDDDASAEVRQLRRRITASLAQPSVLMAYRPAGFLNSVYFPNLESTTLAAMFSPRQRAFEHKPWVEQGLREAGVDILPWRYVSDEDHLLVHRSLAHGPLVLRPSRSSGGEGLVLVEEPEDVEIDWPRSRDAFVAVSPYVADSLPVNLGACVFPDGVVTVHPPSVQLIGLRECTTRRFGYCGNDFAAVGRLPPARLDEIDTMAQAVGRWLHAHDYVGAFGIDVLVEPDRVRLTEVNARFQGSSLVGAQIARACEIPDLYLDHLACFLGITVSNGPSVADWVRMQEPRSQIVCHNTTEGHLEYRPSRGDRQPLPRDVALDLAPPPQTLIDPGAAAFRIHMSDSCTDDGASISPAAQRVVQQLEQRLTPLR